MNPIDRNAGDFDVPEQFVNVVAPDATDVEVAADQSPIYDEETADAPSE